MGIGITTKEKEKESFTPILDIIGWMEICILEIGKWIP